MNHKLSKLKIILKDLKRVLVAFSGGVDSAFLLGIAKLTLKKENVLAITAVSPSLSQKDKKEAAVIAQELNADHQWVATNEFDNSHYIKNPSNRCFYCKSELFNQISPLAQERNMIIVDGYNASDRSDSRPGNLATKIYNVRHPLDEAGLLKDEIRFLSRSFQFSFWNKPASPCLSSRIPHGNTITIPDLIKVEKAEEEIRSLGFRVVRVRHFGQKAKIEVGQNELKQAKDMMPLIIQKVLSSGFEQVQLDPRGYRMGSV